MNAEAVPTRMVHEVREVDLGERTSYEAGRLTLLAVAGDVEPRRVTTRVVAHEHAVVVAVEVNVLGEASGRAAGGEPPEDASNAACHQ